MFVGDKMAVTIETVSLKEAEQNISECLGCRWNLEEAKITHQPFLFRAFGTTAGCFFDHYFVEATIAGKATDRENAALRDLEDEDSEAKE